MINTDQKQPEEERAYIFHLIFSCNSPSLRKVRQEPGLETEADAMEECCFLACFCGYLGLLSQTTRTSCPGMIPSMGWIIPHQLLVKKITP